MKQLLLVVLLVPMVAAVSVFAQDPTILKRALDLPSGGLASAEEDEDNPETISFYGQEFEADAFFWAVPAYGFCGETVALNLIKQEVNDGLAQLSPVSWMGLVAYNTPSPLIWSPQAKKATPPNKAFSKRLSAQS